MDDDAPDIWKRLIVSTSPDEFFEALDSKEKTTISDWKERRLNMLQRRIQEEVVAELETDTSLERKSTPFIRVKVASIIPSGKSTFFLQRQRNLLPFNPTGNKDHFLEQRTREFPFFYTKRGATINFNVDPLAGSDLKT